MARIHTGIGEVVKAGLGSPSSLAPEHMFDSIPAPPARDSFAFGVMLANVFLRPPYKTLFANSVSNSSLAVYCLCPYSVALK